MNIQPILAEHQPCKSYTIDKAVSEYIGYLGEDYREKTFYISPDFEPIKLSHEMSTRNPKFILFSATGATGKTALAKYIASCFHALYWDLSKIKLGENSFDGTIIKALSRTGYSSFIEDLNQAKVLLTIDAFDEAEMISGRSALTSFIIDMSSVITNYTLPPIFLFARTESAQYISSVCKENDIPIKHYEIGFFDERNAKEFIAESFRLKRKQNNNNSTITASIQSCIESYYNTVNQNIDVAERKTFLGYAPVLQAIANHICDTKNTKTLLNSLNGKKECISIIFEIMTSLLKREQNEKFVSGFKMKCSKRKSNFADWDLIYTEKEQLIRLINLILFDSCDYDNYPLDFIPSELVDDYQEQLQVFLPQHPFIQMISEKRGGDLNKFDFTGPAFRDYALARLFHENRDTEAELYWESYSERRGYYIPSQLFYDYYCRFGCNSIYITHLPYVFDSFRAKAKAYDIPYLQCSELSATDDDQSSAIAFMGMSSLRQEQPCDERMHNVYLNSSNVKFNTVSNIVLDLPNEIVTVGNKDSETLISESSIICRSIHWNSRRIRIDNSPSSERNPSGCLISCSEDASGILGQIDININNLKVSIPNIFEYPKLIRYQYKQENNYEPDITAFVYCLRRILTEFRVDKYDTLGKHYEKIDNVVVGDNSFRRRVLEYLKERKIIVLEKASNQYLIDIEKMREASISFAFLSQMREDRFQHFFEEFSTWVRTK